MNWQTTTYRGINISTNRDISSYIVHFLDLSNESDSKESESFFNPLERRYSEALNRSKNYFGRKFHTRTYGGGIGFPSEDYAKQAIDNFLGEEKTLKAKGEKTGDGSVISIYTFKV